MAECCFDSTRQGDVGILGTIDEIPDAGNIVDRAVFRMVDTGSFLWKNMDDTHIIYDKRSGHSQALNDFAREILAIIEEQPCQLSEILSELDSILEHPLDDELRQQVRQTVVTFDEMGLIEPVISGSGE